MEKYYQEICENIIINRNAIGEIVNIMVKSNADISLAIPEAVKYLHDIKDPKKYILVYNRARMPISANSDISKLVNYFIENYNHVTQDLSI